MESGQPLVITGQGQDAKEHLSVAWINNLLSVAQQFGARQSSLLSAAGLDAQALRNPVDRVSKRHTLVLLAAAMDELKDPFFGLHLGEQVRPAAFNALGYAAMSCATLEDAVQLIPRYDDVMENFGRTLFATDGEQATLSWRSNCTMGEPLRPLQEAIVSSWVSFGRWITGQRGFITELHFAHPRPAELTEYRRLFDDVPMHFDAAINALVFPHFQLAMPLNQHDPELNRLMRTKAEAIVSSLSQPGVTTRQVARLLQSLLPREAPNIQKIARELAMSERTLRRRLSAEDTSYQAVLDQVRHELALFYLRESSMSIFEIAQLLGYAEHSSFSHAFRQWTGASAQEYRQQQGWKR
ncbi:AraC family transcriptional regulator [Atopomonas sediminilitoris]|uniref:AraC family transcriptional regulator n=1 Tax=Atopomonas sediminilitoris TaxID=2919919 RepID=UPI001F4D429F|nr:AraC family transcriptional regulator [Atopomonas sediminilitoris]MCJ8168457.1 AraC family transcriptional regulator [Atopomonas sediminilitoris]